MHAWPIQWLLCCLANQIRPLWSEPPREQRGPRGKLSWVWSAQKKVQLINYLCLVRCVFTHQRVSVKALLIILLKHSLTESRQCHAGKWKIKKQREDTAHKGKNYENESLMGPHLGAPWKTGSPGEVSPVSSPLVGPDYDSKAINSVSVIASTECNTLFTKIPRDTSRFCTVDVLWKISVWMNH